MKYPKTFFALSFIALMIPTLVLSGCANPFDIETPEGKRYQPPYYGTYPDSSYYDNDYYKNFEREHFRAVTDHRYDHTFGPNQVYHPSEQPN